MLKTTFPLTLVILNEKPPFTYKALQLLREEHFVIWEIDDEEGISLLRRNMGEVLSTFRIFHLNQTDALKALKFIRSNCRNKGPVLLLDSGEYQEMRALLSKSSPLKTSRNQITQTEQSIVTY